MENGDNLSILFVDDEKQNTFSFKAAFRRDYNILTAESAKDALTLLRNEDIDIVISDQRMPNMTGVELLEQVRKNFPDVLRIIVTGYSDLNAVIDAINHGGVYRYITKPWEKAELRMTIENARELLGLSNSNKKLLSELQQNVSELQNTLSVFSKYVPGPVVKDVLQKDVKSVLSGEIRNAAVLFCDIRGFTHLSEVLDPPQMVELLNDFYSSMTEAVTKYNGSVNAFIGDEVFATFGVPLAYEDNEKNAVLCGMEMLNRRQKMNEKYLDLLGEEFDIGIGVHSGHVIAGNFGSEARLNYSVVGDTVNTCKRIEALTKGVRNSLLISDNVFKIVEQHVDVKTWDPVELKGKKEPIIVHEVLAAREF